MKTTKNEYKYESYINFLLTGFTLCVRFDKNRIK